MSADTRSNVRTAACEDRGQRALRQAERRAQLTGRSTRVFRDFRYATLESWSRRRVIGKAEHVGDKANPRFIVTSLARRETQPPRAHQQRVKSAGL